VKLCLVCSSGGHLQELLRLRHSWEGRDRFWVTFPGWDTDELLCHEHVIHAHHPTNRNLWNLFRNTLVAWRVLRKHRPDVILSTGAGIAIPFFWIGRLLGIRSIFVESLTRIESLSLTGRLVRPVATRFFVQWPELARRVPGVRFGGSIL